MSLCSVLSMLNSMEHWKIDARYGKTYKTIKKDAKFINICTIVTRIFSVISGIFHMFPQNRERKMFYGYNIFESLFPKWTLELGSIYKINFLLIGFVMPATCEIMVYFTAILRYQMMLVLFDLEELDSYDDLNDLELIYDEKYQKKVEIIFRNICKRFDELFRLVQY